MFSHLTFIILLIPVIMATDFPAHDLPCEPATCGDNSNVTACVVTCCCVWCNSTIPSHQRSNLKRRMSALGYCIQASYACQADTIMIECVRSPQSHTFIIVFLSVIGLIFIGWLAWIIVTMTSNIRSCCAQEYTPMSHI